MVAREVDIGLPPAEIQGERRLYVCDVGAGRLVKLCGPGDFSQSDLAASSRGRERGLTSMID
jgi:hypothetical protein